MGLFTFVRDAFERESIEAVPAVELTPLALPYDPVLRLGAQALVTGITSICDVSHEEVWSRLYCLPRHSLPLLDSPAGWIVLAQQMGLPPRVTVH